MAKNIFKKFSLVQIGLGIVGLFYLILPHSTHMSLGIDYGLSHSTHMMIGGSIFVLAIFWKKIFK